MNEMSANSTDPRIDAAFREYLERMDRGEAVNREEFLSQHAEIADTLRNLIAAEHELRKLAGDQASRESAEISTRTFTAPGQDTVPPKWQPDGSPGTATSGLAGKFGRYQIIRALGQGAMGAVYLAQDTHLKRHVAIKTPHFADDPTGELLKRFYREAEAAATLRHANICPVYDVGEIDGKHFISMAYIEGGQLSDLIHGGKSQSERKILIAVHKLAQALQHAHDQGIVHRDLKPANIMVDKQGEPIIMDFGLARKRRTEGEASLTHSGVLLGSPAYMSPEQVEGDPESVGPLSDQYSLGVVLYEMLTGQLPFRGSVVNVLAQIITNGPTPPSELRAGLDPQIEAVCLKMMAKDAADRFPSMKAVADELAAIVKRPRSEPAARNTSPTARATRSASAPFPEAGGAAAIRKSVKQKTLTESDVASLEELAGKCFARRDYDQTIRLIERIPEERRNTELRALLAKAREGIDEIALLICDMDEADRLGNAQAALKKAEALLSLDPQHLRALAIRTKHSADTARRPTRMWPLWPPGRVWNPRSRMGWIASACGLVVVAVTFGVMVIYLRKAAIVIDIKDPGVEVAVKGSTLTVTGPDRQSVKVEPGEQELKITSGGLETTTRSFSLKKGETKTVTVSIVNKELVARLEDEMLLLTPAHEEKTSNTASAPSRFFRPFQVRGPWRIENDELVQPTLAMQEQFYPRLIFGDLPLSNYDFSIEVKKTGGSGEIGIRFHWLGPHDYRNFAISNGGMDFSYWHRNKWGREPGNWKWTKHSSNQWYTLELEVRGSTFRAYEEGAVQFEQTDSQATNGRICLCTSGAAARVRRIKVRDPQGRVLFEGLPELPPTTNGTTPNASLANRSRPLTTGESAAKVAQQEFGERLKTAVVSTNAIGMKLALIPPGEFEMGSPESESQRHPDESQHHVRITKPFYLGVYEVTQSEFERVLGRDPSYFQNTGGQSEKATGPDTSRNPVEQVTWFDALEFCNKLSEKDGRRPYYRIDDIKRERGGWIKDANVGIEGGTGYRLPTEAQWEYACRAGTTTPFSFGTVNNGVDCNCNGQAPYGTEEKGPALGMTAPVGSYRPNAFGLYDMHGNVLEWCWDAYDGDYDMHSPESDPPGLSAGSLRVFRGGSWIAWNTPNCRSAFRAHVKPDHRSWGDVGFRVACDVSRDGTR